MWYLKSPRILLNNSFINENSGYLIEEITHINLKNIISRLPNLQTPEFGNATSIRNLVEIAIRSRESRLMTLESRRKEDLFRFKEDDFW